MKDASGGSFLTRNSPEGGMITVCIVLNMADVCKLSVHVDQPDRIALLSVSEQAPALSSATQMELYEQRASQTRRYPPSVSSSPQKDLQPKVRDYRLISSRAEKSLSAVTLRTAALLGFLIMTLFAPKLLWVGMSDGSYTQSLV